MSSQDVNLRLVLLAEVALDLDPAGVADDLQGIVGSLTTRPREVRSSDARPSTGAIKPSSSAASGSGSLKESSRLVPGGSLSSCETLVAIMVVPFGAQAKKDRRTAGLTTSIRSPVSNRQGVRKRCPKRDCFDDAPLRPPLSLIRYAGTPVRRVGSRWFQCGMRGRFIQRPEVTKGRQHPQVVDDLQSPRD